MNTSAPQARVVLITGAAGGLGQGLVSEFAAQGWSIAAGWNRAPIVSTGERIWPVSLDVTSREQTDKAIAETLSRWGRIDALINNAGCSADAGLWQMSDEEWQRVLDVNLKGAFQCSQAVIRAMCKQRDGHIINLSSFSGRAGARGQANYAAAKAGLIGFTQSLAKEVGSRNVRVNAVLPGVLPTPMTAPLGEKIMSDFAAVNALGRINDIAEVARFIVVLAGMKNVSGQVFQLDSRIAPWA